jgi:hypothetical protein
MLFHSAQSTVNSVRCRQARSKSGGRGRGIMRNAEMRNTSWYNALPNPNTIPHDTDYHGGTRVPNRRP